MFGLFKKKKPAVIESPKADNFVSNIQCLGIQYFREPSDTTDKFIEDIFTKLTNPSRMFCINDIIKLNTFFDFDSSACLSFYQDIPHGTLSMSLVYKFCGVKGKPNSSPEDTEKIISLFTPLRPLKRVDIEKVSQDLGFDVYARCKWKNIMEHTLVAGNITYIYYTPIKK